MCDCVRAILCSCVVLGRESCAVGAVFYVFPYTRSLSSVVGMCSFVSPGSAHTQYKLALLSPQPQPFSVACVKNGFVRSVHPSSLRMTRRMAFWQMRRLHVCCGRILLMQTTALTGAEHSFVQIRSPRRHALAYDTPHTRTQHIQGHSHTPYVCVLRLKKGIPMLS